MILAGATTYNASAEDAERLAGQLTALSARRAIFDNSDDPAARETVRRVCADAGVPLLTAGANLGTAGALNALVAHAAGGDCRWLLYLDQDSVLDAAHAAAVASAVEAADALGDVAVVGCRIRLRGEPAPPPVDGGERLLPARFAIASGTLFRVDVALALGGFDEQMFLDVVDHDYCLRVRGSGRRVVVDTQRELSHEIGRNGRVVPRLRGMLVTEHPQWRRELMWRNSVVLLRRHARSFPADCAKHLVVRITETLVGAVVFRRASHLAAAVRGTVAGFRAKAAMTPASHLNPRSPCAA